MGRILVVDNYDSFTFNLVHILENIAGQDVDVFRNDGINPEDITHYSHIIFSPGPGLPSESPGLMRLLEAAILSGNKVLGVCLGHQGLAQVTGGTLKNLSAVHHGVSLPMMLSIPHCGLFDKCPDTFLAGRYHSWVVDRSTLSSQWIITCSDFEGEVMAMRHVDKPVYGIQFHPESVLTPLGAVILENFLKS